MGALLVVVAQPVWQRPCAVLVGGVGRAVAPFACHRLVEPFDLAVGLRSIRACGEVADLVVGQERGERRVLGVGEGVVGHESSAHHAVAGVPPQCPLAEGGDRRGAFVVAKLDVGEAASY